MGTMGLALGPCSLPGQVVNISLVLVVVVMVMVMLVMVMILFVVFWMVVKNLVLVVVLVPEVFPDMLSGTKQFSCSSTPLFGDYCQLLKLWSWPGPPVHSSSRCHGARPWCSRRSWSGKHASLKRQVIANILTNNKFHHRQF